MKFEIDTSKKEVIILEDIKIAELLIELELCLGKMYKDYTIVSKIQYYPVVQKEYPIIPDPFRMNEPIYPNWPNIVYCSDSSNKSTVKSC